MIYTYISNIQNIPKVLYPNITYTTQNADHVKVDVLSSPTDDIGVNSVRRISGIIQLSVMVNLGKGEIYAAKIADTIVSNFERGTKITFETYSININRTPHISSGIATDTFYMKPITIRYEKIC